MNNLIKIKEEKWFEMHQDLLIQMANTEYGRKLLMIELNSYPVAKLTCNSVTFLVEMSEAGEHVYNSQFYTRKRFANLIRKQWKEFNSFMEIFEKKSKLILI